MKVLKNTTNKLLAAGLFLTSLGVGVGEIQSHVIDTASARLAGAAETNVSLTNVCMYCGPSNEMCNKIDDADAVNLNGVCNPAEQQVRVKCTPLRGEKIVLGGDVFVTKATQKMDKCAPVKRYVCKSSTTEDGNTVYTWHDVPEPYTENACGKRNYCNAENPVIGGGVGHTNTHCESK
jgi:hypothetical protein